MRLVQGGVRTNDGAGNKYIYEPVKESMGSGLLNPPWDLEKSGGSWSFIRYEAHC